MLPSFRLQLFQKEGLLLPIYWVKLNAATGSPPSALATSLILVRCYRCPSGVVLGGHWEWVGWTDPRPYCRRPNVCMLSEILTWHWTFIIGHIKEEPCTRVYRDNWSIVVWILGSLTTLLYSISWEWQSVSSQSQTVPLHCRPCFPCVSLLCCQNTCYLSQM